MLCAVYFCVKKCQALTSLKNVKRMPPLYNIGCFLHGKGGNANFHYSIPFPKTLSHDSDLS